jgi:hypothetical protein
MKFSFIVSLIYVAFIGLIGFAVYWTESAAPLWALLLFPGAIRFRTGSSKKKRLQKYRAILMEKHRLAEGTETEVAYAIMIHQLDEMFAEELKIKKDDNTRKGN